MVDKNLTKDDLKIIESIRFVYKLNNGIDISFDRAVDILKYADLLLEISRGGFVCSRCGKN